MALMTPCAVDTQWAMVTLLPLLSGSHPEQVCDEVHEHLQHPVQGAQPSHVDGDGAQVGDLTTRGFTLQKWHYRIGRWRELRLRSFAHDYDAHPEVIDVEGGDGAVRDRGRGVKVDLDIVHLQVAARSHLAVSSSHRRSWPLFYLQTPRNKYPT